MFGLFKRKGKRSNKNRFATIRVSRPTQNPTTLVESISKEIKPAVNKAIQDTRQMPGSNSIGIIELPFYSRTAQLVRAGAIGPEDIAGKNIVERDGDYIRVCKIINMTENGETVSSVRVCSKWRNVGSQRFRK